jgi:hypothetical protein
MTMAKMKKNVEVGCRSVSVDFDTKPNHCNLTYYLFSMGVPIAGYATYEEASAEEGRLIAQRLKLKPVKGGMWKAWRAHQRRSERVPAFA